VQRSFWQEKQSIFGDPIPPRKLSHTNIKQRWTWGWKLLCWFENEYMPMLRTHSKTNVKHTIHKEKPLLQIGWSVSHRTFAKFVIDCIGFYDGIFMSSFVVLRSNSSLSLCQGWQWDSVIDWYVVDCEGRRGVREDKALVLEVLWRWECYLQASTQKLHLHIQSSEQIQNEWMSNSINLSKLAKNKQTAFGKDFAVQ
jgi:hypothetical protein